MRFKQLDLNQLVCLDALIVERSVTRAAQRLNLTQPALSGALARLRDYFGDDLFVQVGKRLVPTPLTEQLARPVRDVLIQADAITTMRPEFDPRTTDRSIAMTGSDYIGSTLVVKVLRKAAIEAPHLQFKWRHLTKQYEEELDQGDVDLLIIPETYGPKTHPREKLIEDRYVCMVSADNPHVGAELSLEQYLDMGHVICSAGSVKFPTFDEFILQSLGHRRRIEIDAPTFALVPQIVCGTNRVGTVLSRLAKVYARQLPLRLFPVPVEMPPIVEYVFYHKYQERDPAISWFRALLRETASSLEPAGLLEAEARKTISVPAAPKTRKRRASARKRPRAA